MMILLLAIGLIGFGCRGFVRPAVGNVETDHFKILLGALAGLARKITLALLRFDGVLKNLFRLMPVGIVNLHAEKSEDSVSRKDAVGVGAESLVDDQTESLGLGFSNLGQNAVDVSKHEFASLDNPFVKCDVVTLADRCAEKTVKGLGGIVALIAKSLFELGKLVEVGNGIRHEIFQKFASAEKTGMNATDYEIALAVVALNVLQRYFNAV